MRKVFIAFMSLALVASTSSCIQDNNNNNNANGSWTKMNVNIEGNPTITSIGSDLYVASKQGVYKSSNNGNTWEQKNSGLSTVLSGGVTSVNIYANGSTLYVVLGLGFPNIPKFYASTNYGESWSETWQGLTGRFLQEGDGYNNVTAVGFSGNKIFVAATTSVYGQAIYNSSDNFNNSSTITMNEDITVEYGSRIQSIFVENSNIFVFVKTTSLGSGGIYKSIDVGETYNAINNPPSGVEIDIESFTNIGTSIFASNDNGVYKSSNNGTTWTLSSNGILDDGHSPSGWSFTALSSKGSNLFVATQGAVYNSNNSGGSWISVADGKLPQGANHISWTYSVDNYLYVFTGSEFFRTGF